MLLTGMAVQSLHRIHTKSRRALRQLEFQVRRQTAARQPIHPLVRNQMRGERRCVNALEEILAPEPVQLPRRIRGRFLR
jgi:hypothetical protein